RRRAGNTTPTVRPPVRTAAPLARRYACETHDADRSCGGPADRRPGPRSRPLGTDHGPPRAGAPEERDCSRPRRGWPPNASVRRPRTTRYPTGRVLRVRRAPVTRAARPAHPEEAGGMTPGRAGVPGLPGPGGPAPQTPTPRPPPTPTTPPAKPRKPPPARADHPRHVWGAGGVAEVFAVDERSARGPC